MAQVPGNMPGSQPDWIVDILMDERGSRTFLCAVDFNCTLRDASFVDTTSCMKGSTVARHIINSSWRARFPGELLPAGNQKMVVTVSAASDAGWSPSIHKASENPDVQDSQGKAPSWDMPSAATSPSALPAITELGHSLKAFLATVEEKLRDMARSGPPKLRQLSWFATTVITYCSLLTGQEGQDTSPKKVSHFRATHTCIGGDGQKEIASLSSAASSTPSRWTDAQLQRLSGQADNLDRAREALGIYEGLEGLGLKGLSGALGASQI